MINKLLATYFDDFEGNVGAKQDDIDQVEGYFRRRLPAELRQILLFSNGLNGTISEHEIQIWSTREIISYNATNQVQDHFPAFLMFGSDGCGETHTLDYRTDPPSVALVAAIGLDYDSAILVGNNFTTFLERMNSPGSLFDKS